MSKPDDSSLTGSERLAVENRATDLLSRAGAWGRFPTPIDDLLAAAQLTVAPKSVFDVASMLQYVKRKTASATHTLKTALSKVLGIYDANEKVIHIDGSVTESKQAFLKLHEAGHHELPSHRKVFTFFQDCEKTLAPEIADQFEREANNFARFAMFQGTAFKDRAADMPMELRTPMGLAKVFGASVYAAAREFARTHHRACVMYALEPIEYLAQGGARAPVRRIEPSPSFRDQFGCPIDTAIDTNHALGKLLPIGRKMTSPRTLVFQDVNGVKHECLGEAFATKYNVFLLIYVVKSLGGPSIWLPGSSTA